MNSIAHILRAGLIYLPCYPNLVLGLSPFKKFEFRALLAKTRIRKEDIVLDIGSGHGVLTILLGRKCARAVGIDISPEAVASSRRKLTSMEARSNVEFQCTDLLDGHFETGSFDKVFSFSVLEHIPHYEEVLREVHRILKPGGEFIFSCDTLEAINDPVLLAKHCADHKVVKYFREDQLRQILHGSGFASLEIAPLFQSEYGTRLFVEGIAKRFNFGLRAPLAYIRLRYHEQRCPHRGRGIFLAVICKKPGLVEGACCQSFEPGNRTKDVLN